VLDAIAKIKEPTVINKKPGVAPPRISQYIPPAIICIAKSFIAIIRIKVFKFIDQFKP